MLRLPCTSAIGDPDYAGLIVFLIQEERENSAYVGLLLPERARQDHLNSNRERCLFDARTFRRWFLVSSVLWHDAAAHEKAWPDRPSVPLSEPDRTSAWVVRPLHL